MQGTYQRLKARQRAKRGCYPENLRLRVPRALSWLDRAEREGDPDSRFILLWIAFNADYATAYLLRTASSYPIRHNLGHNSQFPRYRDEQNTGYVSNDGRFL